MRQLWSSHWLAGVLAAATCFVLISPRASKADLFLYEDFDYEPGFLDDSDGGIGFDGPYERTSVEIEVGEGSLGYTDQHGNVLETSGNHLAFSLVARTTTWRPLDPSRAPAEFVNENGALGKDGTSLWLSFLYQTDNPDANWSGIALGDGDVSRETNRIDLAQKTSLNFSMGMPQGGEDQVETDVPLDQESLVVVRFDFHELIDEDTFEGEDEIYMWVNPLLDTVPSDDDAVFLPFRKRPELEERGTWQFDYMRLTGQPADTGLDEIRLGTTYQDVVPILGGGSPRLMAGDADQDLDFDQLDLVKVQIAAKYLTGQAATWGDGDWNGAPGGAPGDPPAGNGLFDQLDIIAALAPGHYLTGPYAAIAPSGRIGDSQTSIVYDAGSGEVSVDAPAGTQLTSINIDSAAGVFTGDAAENLGGSFDNDADNNIFKATFGGSFGSISFGHVALPGLTEQFVRDDLTVVGSLAGGGALGDVDLIYVPEPTTFVLAFVAAGMILARRFAMPRGGWHR